MAGSEDSRDIPTNWRERSVDPSSFAFITGTPFETPQETEEKAIMRAAKTLLWQLLLKRVDEVAEIYLTPHQKRVYDLWIKKGNTYQEIGAILSKMNGYSCDYSAYTAISHCVKGIRSNKHGGKYHGGIENRLRKKCEKDLLFQSFLDEWRLLQQDKFDDSLGFLSKHDSWYKTNEADLRLRVGIKAEQQEEKSEDYCRPKEDLLCPEVDFSFIPWPQDKHAREVREKLETAINERNRRAILMIQSSAPRLHPADRKLAIDDLLVLFKE